MATKSYLRWIHAVDLPEVTSPEAALTGNHRTGSDRRSRDPEEVPLGDRMRNRKLEFPALSYGVWTRNDVTRRGFPRVRVYTTRSWRHLPIRVFSPYFFTIFFQFFFFFYFHFFSAIQPHLTQGSPSTGSGDQNNNRRSHRHA